MRVLKKEPAKAPEIIEIDNTLEALQEAVGGYIEVVPVHGTAVVFICDEEGKIKGYPPNFAIPGDMLVGTVIVAGVSADEFRSLNDEEIADMKEARFLGLR